MNIFYVEPLAMKFCTTDNVLFSQCSLVHREFNIQKALTHTPSMMEKKWGRTWNESEKEKSFSHHRIRKEKILSLKKKNHKTGEKRHFFRAAVFSSYIYVYNFFLFHKYKASKYTPQKNNTQKSSSSRKE
jgi:hypothetical protein